MKRFWQKVNKTNGCWLWTAGKDACGYGNFKIEGVTVRAHRFAYRLEYGNIPVGMQVLHRCDTPACVRPSHLFLGTHTDNHADKISKGRQRGAVGERNSHAKLTLEQVQEIRKKYRGQNVSTATIAKIYGVSQVSISYILIGKTWSNL